MYSWQACIITFLIIQHFRWVAFSIYVHRGMGHHCFTFKPALEHFFRFYLWFFNKMAWPNWQQHYAAQHRKHHKYSDLPEDPHSPYQISLKKLISDFDKITPDSTYYLTPEEVNSYAPDISSTNDWMDRNLYCKYPRLGLFIYWILQTILFGWLGFIIGIITFVAMDQISIFLSNWVMHKVGFEYATDTSTGDRSKTVFPFGLIMAGEALHAHHHNDTGKPYFHRHWWEIDTGWIYCRVLMFFGLMRLAGSKDLT